MKNKLKSKKPTRPRRIPLWVEIFFFIGMAVLGFGLVVMIRSGDQAIIGLDGPILGGHVEQETEQSDSDQPVIVLYGAPSQRPVPELSLSPIFMPSVQYWEEDILKWAAEYNLDPNLIATVMQIESCGNPSATSRSNALGLFQVMPFHFAAGEDPYDPDTNALRGMAYLAKGLEVSGGHAGLALAGYNGGHTVISNSYDNWNNETQRYYRWGSGIYREASAGWDSSPTLLAWLAAGGRSLCDQAEQSLALNVDG